MLKIVGPTRKKDAEKLVCCLLYLLTACVELGGFLLANSLSETIDSVIQSHIKERMLMVLLLMIELLLYRAK